MPKLLDADAVRRIILSHGGDAAMLREIERLPDKRKEPAPEWVPVTRPPDSDRNVFICHGSEDFKAPCIGHYEANRKIFYEDRNWFATPIYDAMYWCEMPRVPTKTDGG